MSLKGRSAIVTGASEGIGYACAESFVGEGVTWLLLIARDEGKLERARDALRSLPGGAECEMKMLSCDLADPSGPDRIIEALESDGVDSVDILVNNAGTAVFQPIDAVTADSYNTQMQLNVTSPYFLTQKLLPRLQRSAHASVVNISSYHARKGAGVCATVYQMCKPQWSE
ncbi:unnamed protein product [Vitrella brassicaformis CCMP3155]|uniref:3-oxoacyl-[acyl-carrier-protein] reductase n=2 Tax=Vitrella brassicaformis TaxID=1169539 RepID=A0A0G4FFS9_VITBC|nr:unnamed protein product [Vitrella brassicaformis CCMP3155]|mmetsp:Transcript_45017/g.127095  ORF Transcript_45017/g.127095 Transcript_45017/m.127095 type:complete len:171 (+) Transcript_45017:212-724(+)|eukprot:CEM11903.1 unnamed protein product [Vitrella brassicaformis CCMP3155]